MPKRKKPFSEDEQIDCTKRTKKVNPVSLEDCFLFVLFKFLIINLRKKKDKQLISHFILTE